MGGPLVLLPRDALQLWTGAYGPDGEDDVDEEETDYWWSARHGLPGIPRPT